MTIRAFVRACRSLESTGGENLRALGKSRRSSARIPTGSEVPAPRVSTATDVPERIPGLQLSARRVLAPAEPAAHLLGFAAFHDIIALGGGRWGLAVGDICERARGSRDPAAAQVDIARVVTRAVAQVDLTPSMVLAGMNRALLAGGRPQERWALAAAYVTVRPSLAGTWARICVAGPQTAFLRRSSGRTIAIGRPGSALGLRPDPDLRDSRLLLRAGDILTLVTARAAEGLGGPNRVCEILAGAGRASAARSTAAIARAVRDAGAGHLGLEGVVVAVKVPGGRRDHGTHSAPWPARGAAPDEAAWPARRGRSPFGRTRYPF